MRQDGAGPRPSAKQHFWHATAQSRPRRSAPGPGCCSLQASAILKRHPHETHRGLLNQLQGPILLQKGPSDWVRRHAAAREGGWLARRVAAGPRRRTPAQPSTFTFNHNSFHWLFMAGVHWRRRSQDRILQRSAGMAWRGPVSNSAEFRDQWPGTQTGADLPDAFSAHLLHSA